MQHGQVVRAPRAAMHKLFGLVLHKLFDDRKLIAISYRSPAFAVSEILRST